MSHQCDRLPEELVEIFSAKDHRGKAVLDLQDRVRSMAVCRAWRSHLDPRRWPIPVCSLGRRDAKLAAWLSHIKPAIQKMEILFIEGDDSSEDEDNPSMTDRNSSLDQQFNAARNALLSLNPKAALVELELIGDPDCAIDLLPELNLFPKLTCLQFSGFSPGDSVLKSEHFCSLPALTRLEVDGWDRVTLLPVSATGGSSTLLANLEDLEVANAEHLELDVALPRLRALEIMASNVRLGGDHLQLPALTRLLLDGVFPGQLYVDMDQLTALQELRLDVALLPWLDGLAPLQRLTCLWLDCANPAQQVAAGQLLHSAPQPLQELTVYMLQWQNHNLLCAPLEPSLAAAVCVNTHLTALTLLASGPVPAQLGALSRLQALRLGSHPEGLTGMELVRLGRLRQLQHLVLEASQVEAGEEDWLARYQTLEAA